MCLDSIKEEYETPSPLVQGGWKEFSGTDAKPISQQTSKPIPLDQWIKANEVTISMSGGGSYTSGFHVYSDDTQISKNKGNYVKYRRVYYRNVTYLGTQDGKEVVIAREIYVPSNQKAWPPHPSFPDQTLLDKIKDKLPGGNA